MHPEDQRMNELLSLVEVCELAGLGPDALRKRMTKGTFPRPTHQRGRNKFWSRKVVETAIAALTRRID